MANYSVLKSAIEAVIKTNGNNEITGALLQQTLISMINILGAGFQFVDVATPSTNPGTPDYNVFYVAATAGIYANFGNIVVSNGEVAFLTYNGQWTKKTTGIASLEKVEQLEHSLLGKFYGFFDSVSSLPSSGEPGFAYVGISAPFAIYNFDGSNWSDSGSVYTYPIGNGEDIDLNNDGQLQFANRQNNDGLGYVILRKNTTFQTQVTQPNTIYEIRYSFNLGGSSITIPSGCVLRFNGGELINGTINFNGAYIEGDYFGKISCNCSGPVSNVYVTPQMYGYIDGGDVFNALQSAITYNPIIIIPDGEYYTTQTIRVPSNRKIIGQGNVLINSQIPAYNYDTNPYKDGSIVNVSVFALRGIEDGVDYSAYSGTSGDFLCGVGTALASGNYSTNYVDVSDASGFAIGDKVLISEGLGYWHYVKQEMAEIAAISGTRITFKDPLRYSYNATNTGMGEFFKNYAPPAQPTGVQPILSNFVGCGIRKISPVENVEIENIKIDTQNENASSKIGVFITLSKNIRLSNVKMQTGRLWLTDSQDIFFDRCSTSMRNSYAGNGSNHIIYNYCTFSEGLQIEEGCSDIIMNGCEILSTSIPFSIIAHSKNVTLCGCRIVGEYTSNVCVTTSKCKNVSIIGCTLSGGSTALNFRGNPFAVEYPSATAFVSNKDLTDYYDSSVSCVTSHFAAATTQKSIINEHTSAYINLVASVSVAGVSGLYEGEIAGTWAMRAISATGLTIDGGKGAMMGLAQTSAQLDPSTFVVNARGAWGGESNGSGAEIEGTKQWAAIGCRNGGTNGKLMQNGYDFGIFHPNNTSRLVYRSGTETQYHPILSDVVALTCTTTTRPTSDSHRTVGLCIFDETLGKPIWYKGNNIWVDATGASV